MQPDDTAKTRRHELDATAPTRPQARDDVPTVPRQPTPAPLPAHGDAHPAAQAPGDLTGEILSGKYRVVRLLGKGGFGAVYEAKDEMLGASVAVKVLTPAAAEQEDALQQFLGEARLLTSLDHPNIVRWITFDRTAGGLHYFVMEFLRGAELSKILTKAGRLPHERATAMLLQILGALRAAHSLPDGRSLLHLDLKPQNVFITDTDPEQVKVIDFGISQHVGAAARSAAGIGPEGGKGRDTDLGATIATISSPADQSWMVSQNGVQRARGGTLLYASPEQCKHLRGDPVIDELDGRSDLYSLGVMAFQMLAGRLPWEARTQKEAYKAHLETPAPPLSKFVKVPRALEQFVARCLAKNRDERFKDVREAYEALERVVHPPSKWPLWVAAGAVAAGLAIWGMWPDPQRDEVDVLVADDTMFFGPGRRTTTEEMRKLLPELAAAEPTFVSDPRTGGRALAGWSVRIERTDGSPQLVVEAPADATGIVDTFAYVRFGEDGPGQHSERLRFVYLPVQAIGIGSANVRGAGDKAIDPVGAVLEIELRGARDHVERVQVVLGEQKHNATLDERRSSDALLYQVPLGDLQWNENDGERTAAFEVVVVDRAGNEQRRATPLRIDARKLEFAASLDIEPDRKNFYVLGPTLAPKLRTQANRQVDVTFVARDLQLKEIDVAREASGGDVVLRFPKADESYEGTIEVHANDLERVFHADDTRGRRTVTLGYRYETKAVSVGIVPRHADGSAPAAGGGANTFLTRSDALVLDLTREQVAASVEIECQRNGGKKWSGKADLYGEGLKPVTVPLPAPGRYEIAVRGYRYAGPNVPRTSKPEFERTLHVVRDTTAPHLRLVTPPAAIRGPVDASAPCFTVEAGDDSEAPVALAWSLAGPSGARGQHPIEHGVTGPITLRWQDLGIEPQKLEDGSYALQLAVVDAAGNRVDAPDSDPFVVARHGPSLALVAPNERDWLAVSGNTFQVIVAAADENGVAAVECTLQRRDTGETLATPAMRRTGGDAKRSDWVTQIPLPESWSQKAVTVTWKGRDTFDNVRPEQTFVTTLQSFSVQRPPRVWFEVGPQSIAAPMRLLPGADNYVFGGRTEDEEIALLADFGIEGAAARIGKCAAKKIRVEPFYLDENEVTVGDFARFVETDFLAPAHWTIRDGRGATGAPNDERRARLRAAIAAAPSRSLPMVEIDWYEAAAYASWAGKRLPTHVEWEYAVRGGTAYRPFSCAVPGQPLPRWNVGNTAGTPWEVGTGGDETPGGQGLRNLCSNVMEWTGSASDDPARMHAAGACFADLAFHFRKTTPLEPAQRRSTLGFRCAASASDIDGLLEKPGRIRILTTDPSPAPEAR